MAEMAAQGKDPEILFWVGCAGSFDARAQKVTRALCEVLNHAGVEFAILGSEERCSGDPARRAGNEFLFQMTAAMNIETLNMYGVKKIVPLVRTASIRSRMNIPNWGDITMWCTILS